MKADVEKFFKDLGIGPFKGLENEIAEINGCPVVNSILQSNLVSFISQKSAVMDSPDRALVVHISNLILTYGETAVIKALLQQTEVK